MSCEHYKDALIEVAAAGAAPKGELRAHLDECASCRAAFEQEQSLFTAIDSGLGTTTNAEVPPSLLPRVRAGLDEVAVQPQFRWMQPLILASASAALVLTIFLMTRHHPSKTENIAKAGPDFAQAPVTPEANTNPPKVPLNVKPASSRASHPNSPRNSTILHSAASSNPEVLVPPDEREGLAQLVASLKERGDVVAAFLAQRSEKKDTLVTVDPLKISDIEIKPLEGTEAGASDSAGEKH